MKGQLGLKIKDIKTRNLADLIDEMKKNDGEDGEKDWLVDINDQYYELKDSIEYYRTMRDLGEKFQ